MLYIYYYGFGDTFIYFNNAEILTDIFYEDSISYFKLLLARREEMSIEQLILISDVTYFKTSAEWFMVKITSVLNILALKNYLLLSIIFSCISFFGEWVLFKFFIMYSKIQIKHLAYGILFIPSVTFWGSGILKDTITLSALGLLAYCLGDIFFKNDKSIIIRLIIVGIMGYCIYILKAYIILAFIPSFIIGLYVFRKNKIKGVFIRLILTPVLLILFILIGYFSIQTIANNSDRYKIDDLQTRIEGFQSWHGTLGGSYYDLGSFDYTPMGLLQKAPAGYNVTFFRPYLWEVKNIVMGISALESLIFLLLSLYILMKIRFEIFKVIFNDPLLAISFFFSLLLGVSVGLTSFNFGALSRYKIPCLPFFVFMLIYLLYMDVGTKKHYGKS